MDPNTTTVSPESNQVSPVLDHGVLDYGAPEVKDKSVFRMGEIRRVGTAATMMVVCGTIIIVGTMLLLLGHYSSLSHCTQKAILDGAVIALLMGRHGRWRCLALLGVVYGFVLLLQIGVFYLVAVMSVAGIVGALTGRMLDPLGRTVSVLVAAIVYELLAGTGPIFKIYFGTDNKAGVILWSLWLAELPLRAIGAGIGVYWAQRWMKRASATALELLRPTEDWPRSVAGKPRTIRPVRGNRAIGIRVIASLVACILPMLLHSMAALSAVAVWYLLYALAAGARKKIPTIIVGLLWGAVIFGAGSYAWHRDVDLVIDLFRTFVLRFAPLMLAAAVLISTVRPVDLIRWLRKVKISPIIILPLAQVARSVPRIRAMMRNSKARGPVAKTREFVNEIAKPLVRQWSHELYRADRSAGESTH